MRAATALLVTFSTLLVVVAARAADNDIVVADFEGADYGNWTVSGEAFGPGPAHGKLPDQMDVMGFEGKGLVNSYFHGDRTTGKLTSPPLKVERPYLNFLIGGGAHEGKTCVNLLADGKVVRTATGRDSEWLDWATWDVAEFRGRDVRIEIVDDHTGGWGHVSVDQIVQSDERRAQPIDTSHVYNETFRPQFHFSARKNWINDPNGLVFYKGTYHLFFQHNPFGINWGNMSWGHATSPDLVHWTEGTIALKPDPLGTMFSGSAVVDVNNTSGFKSGKDAPLVAIYTAAGGTSDESKGKPFTQCLAYSTDGGTSWQKYDKNPVLPNLRGGNRDPKIVWHEPSKRWVMTLYLAGSDFAFFNSPDLKSWKQIQTMTVPGCDECPDFFEIPVEGEPGQTRWVWTAANGKYLVGAFDGTTFTPEPGGPYVGDYGANLYAVQSYSDAPAGKRIQIGWMRNGTYPQMPFNHQMSFPCELKLRRFPEGLRLTRTPVEQIESLYEKPSEFSNVDLEDDPTPLGGLFHDLIDLRAELQPGSATEVTLRVRGQAITYRSKEKKLLVLGREAPLEPIDGRITLRVLLDRTSIEVFANDGKVSMTSCFLPRSKDRGVEASATGGVARIVSMKANDLKSAWQRRDD
jgi:fructan beta-fructosidase